jgi:hypothetical protein
MTVGSPASSQARRPAAPARPAASVQHPSRMGYALAAAAAEDELRLDLRDIPRTQLSMEVEGFKPSLLSRLFDLFAPLNRR